MIPTPKIARRKDRNGASRIVVDTRGMFPQRKRITCSTQKEAEAKARELMILCANEGRGAIVLSDALRIEAHECHTRLAALNSSLTEATEHYIRSIGLDARSVPVADAVAAFLREKTEAGRRERYVTTIGNLLRRLASDIPKDIALITAADLSNWMQSKNWSAESRRTAHICAGVLFNFAIRKKWMKENPVDALVLPSSDERTPEVLTPRQAEELMRLSANEGRTMTAFCAIGLFAGVRTSEISGLDWAAIRPDRMLIIGSKIAKKRRTRYIPIYSIGRRRRPPRAPVGDSCRHFLPVQVKQIAAVLYEVTKNRKNARYYLSRLTVAVDTRFKA